MSRAFGDFFIYSWFDEFTSHEVNENSPMKGLVERVLFQVADGEHLRYSFQCRFDGCHATPSVRADRIDAWLAEVYEKGVYDKIVERRI